MRLRCYLPLADTHWFSAGCQDCSHIGAVSAPAAVRHLGGEATVGDLARRLRCTGCGGRRVVVHIASDCRSAETRRREGPLPEVSAGAAAAGRGAGEARWHQAGRGKEAGGFG